MSSETEPEYIAGESWLDFLARRGIPRDKAESIHEIQWLRGERIRWMAEAEEIERLRSALADAIRRPMGVIPDSATGLVTQHDLDAAEYRRTH